MDHPYKVFLSDPDLSLVIAKNIARLFNETGLMQTSFDGLEGVWSTGMGQYARSLFTKTWYDNLNPKIKGKVINDASNPGHFNWHIRFPVTPSLAVRSLPPVRHADQDQLGWKALDDWTIRERNECGC